MVGHSLNETMHEDEDDHANIHLLEAKGPQLPYPHTASRVITHGHNFERFADKDTYDESPICQTLIVTQQSLGITFR